MKNFFDANIGKKVSKTKQTDINHSSTSTSTSSLILNSTASEGFVIVADCPTPPSPSPPPPDDIPLPPGWVQKFSERVQKDYWFNLNNGQSVWVKPTL